MPCRSAKASARDLSRAATAATVTSGTLAAGSIRAGWDMRDEPRVPIRSMSTVQAKPSDRGSAGKTPGRHAATCIHLPLILATGMPLRCLTSLWCLCWAGEKETAVSQEPGRVALVSGGSRGIGAATVRRLAADGWDIGFSYHGDGPSAREVEKDACELGVRATGTDVDVTDAAEVSSWFRLTEEELGPVQAVVSCAGITREQPLARLAEADWRAVIDTSLDGVFHLCRTAVFVMMARRSGRIVTVSSVCGEYDHAPRRMTRWPGRGWPGSPGAGPAGQAVRDQRRRGDSRPGHPRHGRARAREDPGRPGRDDRAAAVRHRRRGRRPGRVPALRAPPTSPAGSSRCPA